MTSPTESRSQKEIMGWAAEPARTPAPQKSGVFAGALWMIGITLALFFLPAVNGLIGGFVGGYRVGTVDRALTAALLPALVVALALGALLAIWKLPVVGLFAGLAAGVVVVLADVGLLLGAVLGGWFATARRR